ncbi:MAG: T9SS type A sorting domain-containing protein [Bacteroides sp.]|nr:T9SS type A sorting domain-containing protein [Bacteroides sp.]
MKKTTIFLMMLIASLMSFAQNGPIDFEPGGHGADWTWTVFENDTNPALEIITNPDPSGINTSATVAKFTALQAGQPWAGVESAHGTTDLGPFVLDATNSTIKIMVWKTVISDVGIKLVSANGWAQVEIKVPNTLVNEWEELTFDFSAYLNPPEEEGQLDQVVVFPDFDLEGREQDNIIYFDNITFNAGGTTPDGPTVAAPTPTEDEANVLSIFSGAYTDVAGTNFNPGWGQSTVMSFVEIAGNETLKYANFNYQGTEFASALNVTQMETIHIDMWTADATVVNFTLISPGPSEIVYSLPITPNQWVSYNIPLTEFADVVDLANVIQFKFFDGDGSPTIFLDNIYFYKDGSGPTEGPNAPIDFEEGGYGADWTWTVFENDTNPALEIIDNPDQSGNNTSAKVAKFTALQTGQPWAGVESAHGTTDLGPFVLDETNSTIKIMVWKTVISDVGIKLIANSGWAQPEIKIANTLVNEWEELTFDFSGLPNPPEAEGQYDQIAIFPDFDLEGREQDNIVYFDNITFSAAGSGGAPQVPAGLAVSNMIGETPVGDGELFIACGPNQVGGDVVYKMFYSKTAEAPADPTTATEYIFGSTAGDGDGINAFGFVLGGLELGTSYTFWLYQYNTVEELFSPGAATASAVSGGGGTTPEGPNAPIDFEEGGYGADWTWNVFENDTNPALEIIANPDQSGANTSATVAKFTALQTGQPYAGVESAHGTTDLGPFVLDETNSTIKIMVWKSVISDVGIKLVANSGWSQPEIKVANTLVDEWEELTFDFSDFPNPPEAEGQYDQIVVFPDFDLEGREQDNIVYFDNITFNAGGTTPDGPTEGAPTPTQDPADVISLFSDAYTDVPVDTWRTDWSQAAYEEVTIDGNPTKKYSSLDYVGIETVANQIDITSMTHFHLDVWSADFTTFRVKLVDFGPDAGYGGGDDTEHEVVFTDLTQGEWVSLDIPLDDFTNLAGRQNIAQLVLSGLPTAAFTVYVDNVFFYSDGTSVNELDAAQSQVRLYPNPVNSGQVVTLNAQVKQLEVFDLSGRMILSTNASKINTGGMNRGVYFVRIQTLNGGLQTQKLIVK